MSGSAAAEALGVVLRRSTEDRAGAVRVVDLPRVGGGAEDDLVADAGRVEGPHREVGEIAVVQPGDNAIDLPLPLEQLTPGDYRLRLVLTDGSASVERELTFTVR